MAEITHAGRAIFAKKQAEETPLIINRFVLANVPGLNSYDPIDLGQSIPDPFVVGTFPVSSHGYINPDRVIYSVQLSPDVGPFVFNWIGLVADDNTLVAVSYIPPTQKFATENGVLGNTLTRNFMIEYINAQSVTGITIEAGTWQRDYTSLFAQQEQRVQMHAQDLYGSQYFIGDGFSVVTNDGVSFFLKAGVGYVDGLRVENKSDVPFFLTDFPRNLWIDVHLDKNISSIDPVFTLQLLPVDGSYGNYIAPNGDQHYMANIANLSNSRYADEDDGVVRDHIEIIDYRNDDFHNSMAESCVIKPLLKDLQQAYQKISSLTAFEREARLLLTSAKGYRETKYIFNTQQVELDFTYFVAPNVRVILPFMTEGEKHGRTITFLKKAGDSPLLQSGTDTQKIYVRGQEGTELFFDVDEAQLILVWTGTRWEANF